MRILVTGRHGQVAQSLVERGLRGGHDIVTLGRPDLDLSGDAAAIGAAVKASNPDVLVSAAAYTSVDKAESEPDRAFAINHHGAAALAAAARRLDVPMIHLSTDYVFDGAKPTPYTEDDATGPTGVYGASKLAGEQAVFAAHDNVAILRTAWVYSPFGANFVRTMLRLAAERDEVGVVSDQIGSPTSALDLADGILKVAANLRTSRGNGLRGLFHMTGSGEASWAEFAKAIMAASAAAGGTSADVRAIATSAYPTPARRPANSRLSCDRLEAEHGVRLPDWRVSTARIVARLVLGNATPVTRSNA